MVTLVSRSRTPSDRTSSQVDRNCNGRSIASLKGQRRKENSTDTNLFRLSLSGQAMEYLRQLDCGLESWSLKVLNLDSLS